MTRKSVDSLLRSFDPVEAADGHPGDAEHKHGLPITVWVPAKTKLAFDRLQKSTKRGVSKLLREVIVTVVADVDARAT